MDEFLKKYPLFNQLDVSRETCLEFEEFTSMIIKKNKKINIISKETSTNNIIMNRHIADSAQIYDFIDLNCNTTSDLGSGGGFPGIVIAIIIKNLKNKIKVKLYEKSYHKRKFLEEVSRKLKLDTEIIHKDIFDAKDSKPETIMARAFKPMPVVLNLVQENFKNFKNLILFMGKNGKRTLKESQLDWDFDYTEKKSVTSKESFLLNIKNIKKKFLN